MKAFSICGLTAFGWCLAILSPASSFAAGIERPPEVLELEKFLESFVEGFNLSGTKEELFEEARRQYRAFGELLGAEVRSSEEFLNARVASLQADPHYLSLSLAPLFVRFWPDRGGLFGGRLRRVVVKHLDSEIFQLKAVTLALAVSATPHMDFAESSKFFLDDLVARSRFASVRTAAARSLQVYGPTASGLYGEAAQADKYSDLHANETDPAAKAELNALLEMWKPRGQPAQTSKSPLARCLEGIIRFLQSKK